MNIWDFFAKEIKDSGIGFFSIMAMIMGSTLSVLFVKPKTRGEFFLMIISGISSAMFIGATLTQYLGIQGQAGALIHFLVALGGMFIIKGILLVYKKFSESPFTTMWQFLNMYMKFKNNDTETETNFEENVENENSNYEEVDE